MSEYALDIAREMAAAGIPVFCAYPDPEGKTQSGRATGYSLPTGWESTAANPAYVSGWKPGMALCAVMGHGLDLTDVDPRNGGQLAAVDGITPRVRAVASTPSDGTHLFVSSMGVRSRDDLMPGIDVKAGTGGQGVGFAFIAPTVRKSKVTGEMVAYRWTEPPDLDGLGTDSEAAAGSKLAGLVRQARAARNGLGFQQPGGHSEGWTDPDIAQLVREGIPDGQAQQPVLRDLVARLVGQGYDRTVCWGIWQAIVDRTTLGRPDWPWAEADFADMYDSAARKYDTRPGPSAAGTKQDEKTKERPPSTAVPACDPGMFRGVPGEIVEAADAGTEADKVGVYASLLSAVSALIGNSPCILIGNSRHPLLIWSLLIGRTNIGRKGEAASTAMRVVRRAVNDVYDITESGLSSGEGLIERLRDIDDAEDTGGTNDKRLLVIETEMAMVMAACAREGTKLPGILRQAWEGERLSSLNRKRITASYSHIAIMGHITPREFRAKLKDSDLAGGTWNRYLPFYVERRRRIPLPTGLDEDIQLPGLAKKLGEAVDLASHLRAIDLTDDAARLWSGELYQEFSEFDEDTAAADFVQRAAPYCRRLAALHAALDGRGSASAADLQAAAHLIRYSIASARYVLDPAPRDVRLDKLRRAVDEAGMAGLSRAEARNVFGGHLPKEDMDNLIEQLCADGSYVQEEIPTEGRPKTVIRAARKGRKAR